MDYINPEQVDSDIHSGLVRECIFRLATAGTVERKAKQYIYIMQEVVEIVTLTS